MKLTKSGTVPLQKKLCDGVVPHIFKWTAVATPSSVKRKERIDRRKQMISAASGPDVITDDPDYHTGPEVEIPPSQISVEVDLESDNVNSRNDVSVSVATVSTSTQTPETRFSVDNFSNDPEAIHFYTGLEDYRKFTMLLDCLGPAAYSLDYYLNMTPPLPVRDQLFLTLIKLRQHKGHFELSRMFKLTVNGVTNVFVTWINFMYYELTKIHWWPERELVRYYCPEDFKRKYPKTRAILDGTECPIQKPKQPIAQKATFSSYKNRNTLKSVIGMTPGGLVSYISPAYGGSTSDRQVMERSNLAQMCDAGDSLMVDKGFNCDDLFIPYKVSINLPSFFKKQNRIAAATVIKDRQIASKRVHIERIVGLGKTYKILNQPLNNTESALGTEIITICYFLCNFRTTIMSEKA